jgi:hypothetical protein
MEMSIEDEMKMYAKVYLDIKNNPRKHKKLKGSE